MVAMVFVVGAVVVVGVMLDCNTSGACCAGDCHGAGLGLVSATIVDVLRA